MTLERERPCIFNGVHGSTQVHGGVHERESITGGASIYMHVPLCKCAHACVWHVVDRTYMLCVLGVIRAVLHANRASGLV